jgi:hypothetical protein
MVYADWSSGDMSEQELLQGSVKLKQAAGPRVVLAFHDPLPPASLLPHVPARHELLQ